MKGIIKRLLLNVGVWRKIQFSHWYRELKIPGYRQKLKNMELFYLSLFKGERPKLIFDIGASIGDYSYVFSHISDRLVVIEPDATNNKILLSRFGGKRGCTVIKKAVSKSTGTSEFYMESEGGTLNTLSNKWVSVLENVEQTRFHGTHNFVKTVLVETTTLDTLINEYGMPNYIKIDVEGFEKEVIEGLHMAVPIISFECNLPEFAEETIWIIGALEKLNSRTTFNFICEDRFVLPNPINAFEMVEIVRSGKYRFMEIFSMS